MRTDQFRFGTRPRQKVTIRRIRQLLKGWTRHRKVVAVDPSGRELHPTKGWRKV